MQCTDFFTQHLAWLKKRNPVHFVMSSNSAEPNQVVFYGEGNFLLESDNVITDPSVKVLFSDRTIDGTPFGDQPFALQNPELNKIRLTLPSGPLERLGLDGHIIAKYSLLECSDKGVLICTGDFTREIVLLSFVQAFPL